MPDQSSSSSVVSAYAPTPPGYVFAAGIVLGALVLLGVLVLIIVRSVVDKARPEDLPDILLGLGDVFASLACFLPWGKVRKNDPPESAQTPQGGGVVADGPRANIVAGHVVIPPLPSASPDSLSAAPGERTR